MKKRAVWIHWFDTQHNLYVLDYQERTKAKSLETHDSSPGYISTLCAAQFEYVTGFSLKPGDGPKKIHIYVEEVKE